MGSIQDAIYYTYGNSNWGDLLTAYDGKPITYDTIGNPLTYDGWTFTWEHGRELASMAKNGTTWSFTYDANGLRTKRTNGTTTYQYVYNGSKLTQMSVNGTTVYFAYHANGHPDVMIQGQNVYHYITNLRGDVMGIVSEAGQLVVSYEYDAWGNVLEISGSMAETLGELNPLRYRGYVYDHETGLYYLQSRYYNPTWGRFLNADALISTGQGELGNNMFAYCNNNPVRYSDPSGYALIEALIAAVGIGWAITIVVGGIVIICDLVWQTLNELVDWLSRQWYRPFAHIEYSSTETVADEVFDTAESIVQPSPDLGDDDDDGETTQRIGKQNGNAPRSNEAQNKSFNSVVKKLGLNKKQSRILHDEISGMGMSYQEILLYAKEIFMIAK